MFAAAGQQKFNGNMGAKGQGSKSMLKNREAWV